MEISTPSSSVHLRFPPFLKPFSSLPTTSRPPLSTRRFSGAPLIVARSLPDDASTISLATQPIEANRSAAKADPFFAVQKKAMEVVNDLKGTSIFLIGMNSSMKASIGEVIAKNLRYYYFDSDALVEEAAGDDSSGKPFRERDDDGFRESETEVLRQLSSMGRLIVNAGNGAVQSATNLSFLRHGITIWIDVPMDMIAKEYTEGVKQKSSSPASSFEVLNQLTAVYQENKDGYAEADACISLLKVASNMACDEYDQVTAEDMALELLKEIEKLTRVKKMMEEAGKPF